MTDENHALAQANAQMASVRAMVAALECDFDRLEELRDLEEGKHLDDAELEELAELEAQAGDCEDAEEAESRILEDALSVEVRSGWGAPGDCLSAEEFRIVLCTGGPHVQIRGELDENREPYRAWLEYQDWGTPMAQRLNESGDQAVLLAYCARFCFDQ